MRKEFGSGENGPAMKRGSHRSEALNSISLTPAEKHTFWFHVPLGGSDIHFLAVVELSGSDTESLQSEAEWQVQK